MKGKISLLNSHVKTMSERKLSGPCTDSQLGWKEELYYSQRIKYITFNNL